MLSCAKFRTPALALIDRSQVSPRSLKGEFYRLDRLKAESDGPACLICQFNFVIVANFAISL